MLVHKFILGDKAGSYTVEMQRNSMILSVGGHLEKVVLYAAMSQEEETEKRVFELVYTGQYKKMGSSIFHGSVALFQGNFVLHVFELIGISQESLTEKS